MPKKKIFGRVGAKSEGTPPGVPKSFFFRSCRSTTLQLNPKTAAIGEWRVANGERKTRNPILRFTHHASRSTHNSQLATLNPISGLTPLLPVIFTLCALRFTLPTNFGANAPPTCQFHALRFTLLLVPRPSPLVPFRDVIFITVNSKMAKMAGK